MTIDGIQHINIRCADLERTRDFYVRILGLRVGHRPPFQSTGYWLYFGDQPLVHLVQRVPGDAPHAGSGNIDHVAFGCTDLQRTRDALTAAGVAFREAAAPDGTAQIRAQDPDGIQLELNFEQPSLTSQSRSLA
jgi:catechol 2,3-dioxygenase-like lactoylglutathione lyase family enzyme